jgi:SAM-dependent methyltransferase
LQTQSDLLSSADMSTLPFDDLTDVYDAMIDWPKRLAGEAPFFRELFDLADVRAVLDAACGTGRHAAMFHSWGLRVEGADVSPNMIRRARASFGEPQGLRWSIRGFDQPVVPPGSFDAAVCVGNSLALAPDVSTAERAVRQLLAAARPGGAVVIHLLNLWSLPEGPIVWQKCRSAALPQGESLIIKGVHRSGARGYVDLLIASPDGGPWRHAESVPLVGLEAEQLAAAARDAEATSVELLGGYGRQPYDRDTSVDLILVARR